MADNRTMAERGFTETQMSAKELTEYILKHDLNLTTHLIGDVYSNSKGNICLVVKCDYNSCNPVVWIKE